MQFSRTTSMGMMRCRTPSAELVQEKTVLVWVKITLSWNDCSQHPFRTLDFLNAMTNLSSIQSNFHPMPWHLILTAFHPMLFLNAISLFFSVGSWTVSWNPQAHCTLGALGSARGNCDQRSGLGLVKLLLPFFPRFVHMKSASLNL